MRLKNILVVLMALMFLTTSLFTVAFSESVLTKETKLTQDGEGPQTTQATAGDSTLNQKELNKASDFGNAKTEENLARSQSPNIFPFDSFVKDISTNKADMWRDFAKVDEDSAELVIGINNAQPDSYVKFSDLIFENGGKLVNTVSIESEKIAVVADLPLALVPSFVENVQASSLARYVEPNMKYQTQLVPNDPYWIYQWGPQKIEADYAWDTTIGNSSVLVAVIDTGIDWDHPDLAANYVALGYDWVNSDDNPMDDNGHGTHCAGIIAAELNNSIGIAGLAQVQIMAEKGLDQGGYGYEDDLASAIYHAVDQGADILSNSWGGYGGSMLIHDAVKYAHVNGVLVVAAAGNGATRSKHYPAAYDEVIAVTATDQWDDPASFTNFGDWVEVAAPGVDIYSTFWDDNYMYMSGTSMSTPHVSGTAALIMSQFPNATRDWVRAQLRYAADDLGDLGFDDYYGYGRINARKAVEQAPPDHDLLIFDWERPPYVKLGELVTFNTTVFNFGISDETNVEVQLLVDGSLINSTSIAFLPEGASATVGFSWTPTVEGTYNVTSYVVPVPDETMTQNNLITEIFTVVAPPRDANWILLATDPDEGVGTSLKAIYGQLYSGLIYFKVEYHRPWTTINDIDAGILIDADQDPSTGLPDGYYPGQNTGIGADYLIIVGFEATEMWRWDPITEWWDMGNPISFAYLDAPDGSNVFVVGVSLSEVETAGVLDCAVADILSDWDWMPDAGYFTWLLIRYEHELTVFLETPQRLHPEETALLNAIVYNLGLNNETNVKIQLLINGNEVANETLDELVNGTGYTINYSWTPTMEGVYNITAYAPPVPDENVTANNIMSKMVYVRYVDVALISDRSELLTITGILDSMGIGYDIYNDNSMHLYTEDLSLLLDYQAVIFYTDYRYITSDEYSALESYLSSGGNLLVTGFDCLVGDYLLADLVRSSSYGDNVGEPDLYVVDATHPIMNGPYGSFPAGYHISGLYSDCDAAEADTARMAATVAELWDGYDRIIATDGLLGKVVFWNGVGPADWVWNADCEAMFKNTLVWFLIRYEHELIVSLDAPAYLEPGDSSLLNATVLNRGLSNETSVDLFLLINGTIVNNATIPELVNGTSHKIDYLWIPTIEATYNITAYALPVPDENITTNNIYSAFVTVRFAPRILAYVQYTDYYQEYMNSLTAIDSTYGPAYILTELWDYTQLDSMLPGNDILFIPEQEWADLYVMQGIGATWSTTLSNFVKEGGVIILCDFNWGNGGTYGILTGAGLMSISGANYRTWSTVYLVDPTDPLASGVSSSFTAPDGTLSFVTDETNVVFDDGTNPVVIHKKVGQGHIALIGFDYYASNPDTDQILGNTVGLAVYMTISISPSAGSLGTEVTVTGIKAAANGTVEFYWDETFMENTTADADGSFTYLLTVPLNATAGPHEIRAVDVTTGETSSRTFRVIFITIDPLSGPIGTKVTVNGAGFSSHTQVLITFNDMLLGYAMADDTGNFTFVFNILVSTAGSQTVKAFDAEANYAGTTFTVVDVTPLDVEIDVGTIHFRGELAEFYAQTTFKGVAVDATYINALLYKPDGTTEALTVSPPIATGFYKITYAIPEDAPTGTYALDIKASYYTVLVEANGTSFKSFLLSPTLTGWNALLININGTVGTLKTDVGLIEVKLDDINATLVSIEGSIATINSTIGLIQTDISRISADIASINGTVATIQTTLGTLSGTITSILDDIATIETDIGTIKAVLEGWMGGTTSSIITPEGTFRILVLTTSALEGPIEFSDNVVTVSLIGPSDTAGTTNIVIPKQLLVGIESSIGEVAVTLDDEQVVFTYTEQPEAYVLSITYTHSTHTMKIYLAGLPPTLSSWVLYVIATAIIVLAVSALLAIYILKIRKPRVAKTK